MTSSPTSSQWVATAVSLLTQNRSWTGRVHTHKLLFISDALGTVRCPFEFELYHYGPYSFELDEQISEMESFGYLSKSFPQPGYGPRYQVTNLGRPLILSDDPVARSLGRVAQYLGSKNSTELEVIATCLWAKRREGLSGESVIERVHELKPKYSKEEIATGLKDAEHIESRLKK